MSPTTRWLGMASRPRSQIGSRATSRRPRSTGSDDGQQQEEAERRAALGDHRQDREATLRDHAPEDDVLGAQAEEEVASGVPSDPGDAGSCDARESPM